LGDDRAKDQAAFAKAVQRRSSQISQRRLSLGLGMMDSSGPSSKNSFARRLTQAAVGDSARLVSTPTKPQRRSLAKTRPPQSGKSAHVHKQAERQFAASPRVPSTPVPIPVYARELLASKSATASGSKLTKTPVVASTAPTASSKSKLAVENSPNSAQRDRSVLVQSGSAIATPQQPVTRKPGSRRKSPASQALLGIRRPRRSVLEAVSDSEPEIGSRTPKPPASKVRTVYTSKPSRRLVDEDEEKESDAQHATHSLNQTSHDDDQGSVDLGVRSDDDDHYILASGSYQATQPTEERYPVEKPQGNAAGSGNVIASSQLSEPHKKLPARRTAQRTSAWANFLTKPKDGSTQAQAAAKTKESVGNANLGHATEAPKEPISAKRARRSSTSSEINLKDFKRTPKRQKEAKEKNPVRVLKRPAEKQKYISPEFIDSSDLDSDMGDIPAHLPISED
jgi:hypothetical protein